MADGIIVNFDQPRKLLKDPKTILYQLTKNLSDVEKKHIFDVANGVVKSNQIENGNGKSEEDTISLAPRVEINNQREEEEKILMIQRNKGSIRDSRFRKLSLDADSVTNIAQNEDEIVFF